MLQQILNDMFVEPELLAELDEEQKQILFCKMREEQIRKWRLTNEQEDCEEHKRMSKEGEKKVSFLVGSDGEPIVVVLGGDDDVDAILQERAKEQAEMEGEALRKAAEEELDKLVRLSQSTVRAMEQNSLASRPTEVLDPTREAVVRSLQEATKEMEREIRALELQERRASSPVLQRSVIFNSSTICTSYSASHKDVSTLSKVSSSNNIHSDSNASISNTGKPKDFSSDRYSSRPQITVLPYAIEGSPIVPFGVAAQIQQFERMEALKTATLERAKNRRQKEILDNLRNQVEAAKNQAAAESTASLSAEREEVAWREQERKAKEAERRIREIARQAREEHRRTTSSSITDQDFNCKILSDTQNILKGDINGNIKAIQNNINECFFERKDARKKEETFSNISTNETVVGPTKLRPARPTSRDSIVDWFKEEELPRGVGLNMNTNQIEPWFHGIISRTEAEHILEKASIGSFLIRVSERIWGYAVSYRGIDRFHHYLVEAIGGKYAFLGSHQAAHRTIGNLIEYHTREYITASGCELLNKPCGQSDPIRPDYLELFAGTKYFAYKNS